jgi:hypothetical protein
MREEARAMIFPSELNTGTPECQGPANFSPNVTINPASVFRCVVVGIAVEVMGRLAEFVSVGVPVVVFLVDGINVLVDVSVKVGCGDTVLDGDIKRVLDGTTICVALDVFVQDAPTMVRTQNNKVSMVFLLNTFYHPIVIILNKRLTGCDDILNCERVRIDVLGK